MTGESGATVGGDPKSVELAELAPTWRSAYVHVPFCAQRCPYCDFAVVTSAELAPDDEVGRYLRAIGVEIEMEADWESLAAVNFGGGTPSRLAPGDLLAIVTRLRDRFGIESGAEVSLEANPEDWSAAYGDQLAAGGFTRASFGAQSYDKQVLGALGRIHRGERVDAAVQQARRSGFSSVNLDLIFGTPGETMVSWRTSLERALATDPDHLSAYALTVERGTALSRAVGDGAPAPDPDDQADKYEHLLVAAAAAGLVRYEVSNFARPGHVCRYNLATWGQGEYIAFGLGAHDHRAGTRHRNLRRLDAYLERVEAGRRPHAGDETLGAGAKDRERVALGLRRVAGVAPGGAGSALVASEEGRRLLEAGVLVEREGRLVVARPLLTDLATRAVLSVSPGDC